MNKARTLTNLVDETKTSETNEAMKSGQEVRFKSGPDQGLTGYLVDKNADGTWNLKLGNATRKMVKEAELEAVSNGPLN